MKMTDSNAGLKKIETEAFTFQVFFELGLDYKII